MRNCMTLYFLLKVSFGAALFKEKKLLSFEFYANWNDISQKTQIKEHNSLQKESANFKNLR